VPHNESEQAPVLDEDYMGETEEFKMEGILSLEDEIKFLENEKLQ